jgi:hypothetical protein
VPSQQGSLDLRDQPHYLLTEEGGELALLQCGIMTVCHGWPYKLEDSLIEPVVNVIESRAPTSAAASTDF